MSLLQTVKKKGGGGGVSRYILAVMVLGCFFYVYADTGVTGRKGGPQDRSLTAAAVGQGTSGAEDAGPASDATAGGVGAAAASASTKQQTPAGAGPADGGSAEQTATTGLTPAGSASGTTITSAVSATTAAPASTTTATPTNAGAPSGAAPAKTATAPATKDTTRAGGMDISEHCSTEDSEYFAQQFKNLTRDVPFWTACSQAAWIDKFHAISPTGPKTFMDVGCNKGYTSAHFFALWAPEVGFRPAEIPKRKPGHLCGTCSDCQEEPVTKVQESEGGVTVYCLEPSMRNFANLILVRDAFFENAKRDVQWYVMNAAMSNDTKMIQFPRGCQDELCSLDGQSDGTQLASYDWVQLQTVDHFVKTYEPGHIDVLKIDTEGYDATVLEGAMETIVKGKVDIVSFEYHEVGVWREYRLKDYVEKLDGLGYVCYYDGKPSLSRMTGCWADAYEAYAWSNVVCVPRKHKMYPVMERMTTRWESPTYRAVYFKDVEKPAGGAPANTAVPAAATTAPAAASTAVSTAAPVAATAAPAAVTQSGAAAAVNAAADAAGSVQPTGQASAAAAEVQ